MQSILSGLPRNRCQPSSRCSSAGEPARAGLEKSADRPSGRSVIARLPLRDEGWESAYVERYPRTANGSMPYLRVNTCTDNVTVLLCPFSRAIDVAAFETLFR
jgi:hypothetical protein